MGERTTLCLDQGAGIPLWRRASDSVVSWLAISSPWCRAIVNLTLVLRFFWTGFAPLAMRHVTYLAGSTNMWHEWTTLCLDQGAVCQRASEPWSVDLRSLHVCGESNSCSSFFFGRVLHRSRRNLGFDEHVARHWRWQYQRVQQQWQTGGVCPVVTATRKKQDIPTVMLPWWMHRRSIVGADVCAACLIRT